MEKLPYVWTKPLKNFAEWPDLAKFRHFGKILKVFKISFVGVISFLQNFVSALAIFAIRQILIVVNDQKLSK